MFSIARNLDYCVPPCGWAVAATPRASCRIVRGEPSQAIGARVPTRTQINLWRESRTTTRTHSKGPTQLSWECNATEIYHLRHSAPALGTLKYRTQTSSPPASRKQVDFSKDFVTSSYIIRGKTPLYHSHVFARCIYSPARSSRKSSLAPDSCNVHQTKRTRFLTNLDSMTPSTSFPLFRVHYVDHSKQARLRGQQTQALKASGPTLVPAKPINARSPLKD